MKMLFALLLLLPVALLAQSPFDGTWIIDTDSTQLPQKPAAYLLYNGMFDWAGTPIKAALCSGRDGGHYKKGPAPAGWARPLG